MNISEFTEQYLHNSDDELLCLWADRATLVPDAVAALDSELQRRGLKKQDAARIKKRMDTLAARESNGPLSNQVAAAKYERNMRHFVGSTEPEFNSPYAHRDPRNTFAYLRHKYRVWKAFHDHTGHWPVLSIGFHFVSWIAVAGLSAAIVFGVEKRKLGGAWGAAVIIACILALVGARTLGARLVRKLDWQRYGG